MVRQFQLRCKWQLRLLIAAGALSLAAGASVRAHPVAASAVLQGSGGSPVGVYEIVSRQSGKCLDIADMSLQDMAPAIQWTCRGSESQHWAIEPLGNGYYRVRVQHSGQALDVAFYRMEDLAPVVQSIPYPGENQQWALQPVGGGYFQLVARHSGKALSVSDGSSDGAPVVQDTLTDSVSQQWLLRAFSPDEANFTADIVRFLEQSTFGPTPDLVEHVRKVGFEGFLNEQFEAPASSYPTLPLFPTTRDTTACPNGSACVRDNYTMYPLQNRFFVNALYGEDQLRQRVAFALHQIIVVSGVQVTQPSWMAPYLQVLDRNAFGNFRHLLYEITVNPAMGNYLSVQGNRVPIPNENYAREVLQLFSIGTVRLNLDGTQQLDESGQPIPTYTQETVNNFARVFTGWLFAPAPAPGVPNYIDPMVTSEARHDTGAKTLLNGVVLPAKHNTRTDLNDALDNIFNDPNVGPFISKQLIQDLVTSNPSPAYVARIATVFNGAGAERGDLRAVVEAILLDPEARGDVKTDPSYGRLRHPAQFIANVLRAFNATSADGASASDGYLNPQSVAQGMDVFRPPSVFSYFSPSTGVPGGGGLRGPEFGIFSTSTALARLNFVNTMVFSKIAVSANAPSGTSIDLTPLLPLAANTQDLIKVLDQLLLHGSMSGGMRDSITAAVSAVPATSAANNLRRVRTAVYLVLTSSQYQVEK